MIYFFHLLIYFDIYLIVALSLNIVVGYCGIMSLAHASFFVIGAYTYALTTLNLGWGFLPAFALAAVVAAIVSPILSFAAWRLRGDFFVLFSLAVQTMLFSVFYDWHDPERPIGSLANFTNGSFGISGVVRPSIAGVAFSSVPAVALLFTIIAAMIVVVTRTILSSPWGRVLKAMRDDELATRSLGKKARTLKVQALAIACAMAAAAGAMYGSYVSYVDPDSGALSESILFLSMIIVGGVGNRVRGPVVGALLLLLIPEALRFVALPDTLAVELRLLIYGLLLVLLMHFRPQGIAGGYKLE